MIKKHQEIGFDKKKGIRLCRAKVTSTDGIDNVLYKIYWQDAKSNYFNIQMVDVMPANIN